MAGRAPGCSGLHALAKAWSALPSVPGWQLCGAYPGSSGWEPSRAQTSPSPAFLPCGVCSLCLVLPVVSAVFPLPPSLFPQSHCTSEIIAPPLTFHPLLHLLPSLLLPQRLPSFPVLGFTVPSAPLGCGLCVHRPIPSLRRPLLRLSPTPHFSCKDFGHVLLLAPAEWRAFPSLFF